VNTIVECPRCHSVAPIRHETAIKGSLVTLLYICGPCGNTWEQPQQPGAPPPPERHAGRRPADV